MLVCRPARAFHRSRERYPRIRQGSGCFGSVVQRLLLPGRRGLGEDLRGWGELVRDDTGRREVGGGIGSSRGECYCRYDVGWWNGLFQVSLGRFGHGYSFPVAVRDDEVLNAPVHERSGEGRGGPKSYILVGYLGGSACCGLNMDKVCFRYDDSSFSPLKRVCMSTAVVEVENFCAGREK